MTLGDLDPVKPLLKNTSKLCRDASNEEAHAKRKRKLVDQGVVHLTTELELTLLACEDNLRDGKLGTSSDVTALFADVICLHCLA
jgi:hypothetical protein